MSRQLGSTALIEELNFGEGNLATRAYNRLKRGAGCRTIADVLELGADELLTVDGMGPTTLHVIRQALQQAGHELPKHRANS